MGTKTASLSDVFFSQENRVFLRFLADDIPKWAKSEEKGVYFVCPIFLIFLSTCEPTVQCNVTTHKN